MRQRIPGIFVFFLRQRSIVFHQCCKRNMYSAADSGKCLFGQHLLNHRVHEILRIVLRYPLMFLQIYLALLGIALVEHIEHGVDLALDHFKIVIFDVSCQIAVVGLVITWVLRCDHRQRMDRAGNCNTVSLAK